MSARQVRYQSRPTYRPAYQPPQRKSPRRLPKLGQRGRRALFLLGGVVVLLIIIDQAFAVRTITIVPTTSTGAIQPEVERALGKQFFPANLITLNSGELISDLVADDSSLGSATVQRQWPHGLTITISEKVGSLGWDTAGQTYVIDHTGTILQVASSDNHLVVVQDDSNLPVKLGEQVTTPQFVTFCQELEEQMPNTGLSITKMEIHDTTFDLYVTTNRGYQVIFDTSESVTDELGALKTTLAALAQQHKIPTKYIDLRVAGRAYYQ